jgi:hypothetical protein
MNGVRSLCVRLEVLTAASMTMAVFYQTTRRNNPEDSHRQVYEWLCDSVSAVAKINYSCLKKKILSIQMFNIERHGQVVSTPASYSGGPRYKSRPGDQL